jgi:signal peptidase I
MADRVADKKSAPRQGVASELYFWAQALVYALIVLVCVNVFFFRISGVDGSSMEPTFQDHDQIIMRIIGYDVPQRGDVVVVMAPGYVDEPLVKRVIAVGGDTVSINFDTGNVVLNGEEMLEPYISEAIRSGHFGDQSYPVTVPEGQVFVMGDNRNASTDSRWVDEVGTIPYGDIVGKVMLLVWPLTKIGLVR